MQGELGDGMGLGEGTFGCLWEEGRGVGGGGGSEVVV